MPDKKIPEVDYKHCMACRVCIIACPFSCLDAVKTDNPGKKGFPELVKAESCTGCGICAQACPVEVIRMVS